MDAHVGGRSELDRMVGIIERVIWEYYLRGNNNLERIQRGSHGSEDLSKAPERGSQTPPRAIIITLYIGFLVKMLSVSIVTNDCLRGSDRQLESKTLHAAVKAIFVPHASNMMDIGDLRGLKTPPLLGTRGLRPSPLIIVYFLMKNFQYDEQAVLVPTMPGAKLARNPMPMVPRARWRYAYFRSGYFISCQC